MAGNPLATRNTDRNGDRVAGTLPPRPLAAAGKRGGTTVQSCRPAHYILARSSQAEPARNRRGRPVLTQKGTRLMAQALRKAEPTLPLKDLSLFRQQCYVGGKWVDADSRETIDVLNPATNQIIGTVP